MSTADSGVSRCSLPSRCERKVAPFLVHFAPRGKAEHLIAAAVGEDRLVPADECVKAAECADALGARPQIQMIGIGEDDLRAQVVEIAMRHRLHGALRADRHEGRRVHDAVRRREHAAPRGAMRVRHFKPEHQRYIRGIVKKLRVGIIYGGRSGEHEVSIASAAAVVQNLDKQRYEAIPIRIEKDGRWIIADRLPVSSSAAEVIEQSRANTAHRLGRGGREAHLVAHPGDEQIMTIERGTNPAITGLALDVVFPVLHGPYGEDGTVQGLLELANIPYVGAGVLSSAVGMDKAVAKLVFAARGLPQANYLVVLRKRMESGSGSTSRRPWRPRLAIRCS